MLFSPPLGQGATTGYAAMAKLQQILHSCSAQWCLRISKFPLHIKIIHIQGTMFRQKNKNNNSLIAIEKQID